MPNDQLHTRAIVYYDADCSVCSKLIVRLKLKALEMDFLDLGALDHPLAQQRTTVMVQTPEGPLLAESKATDYLLEAYFADRKWVSQLNKLIPLVVKQRMYRVIAKHRGLLSQILMSETCANE